MGFVAPQPAARKGGHLAYLPGLDGLRALAVLAVLLYHADMPWMPGGFLGVEVFFVLSGYLITSLLVGEWRESGKIDLKAFWLRRARRLLPALFLLLIATLIFAELLLPEEVSGLRGDVLAAAAYITNWKLIFAQQSYFEMVGRPPMLQHLWSLAVEEQFYLLWPLIFVGGMALLRRRWRLLPFVLAGALGSVALMAALYQPDADPSRIYYGTDTRASALLFGCALALAWQAARQTNLASRARLLISSLLDFSGLVVLGALLAIFVMLDETQPLLYQGGFALTSAVTLALIVCAVHPAARFFPALLSLPPLKWVGTRSYGIYLWHWPIFCVTRPQLDLPLDGAPLLALRFAFTLCIAELSYRIVETPIRTGALSRAWKALRQSSGGQQRRRVLAWSGSGMACVALVLALGIAAANAQPPAAPSYLDMPDASSASTPAAQADTSPGQDVAIAAGQTPTPLALAADATPPSNVPPQDAPPDEPTTSAEADAPPDDGAQPPSEFLSSVPGSDLSDVNSLKPATSAWAASQASPAAAQPTANAGPAATVAPISTVASQPTTKAAGGPKPLAAPVRVPKATYTGRVTAIGDSVMLGSVTVMRQSFANLDIDALKGRQVSQGITLLQAKAKAGTLGDVVVIHLGTNGYFTAKQFDQLMQVLGPSRRVIFLNNKVPRRWEASNNAVIAAGVQRYPNTSLLDWYSNAYGRTDLLYTDGIHLRPAGARFYTQLIVNAVDR